MSYPLHHRVTTTTVTSTRSTAFPAQHLPSSGLLSCRPYTAWNSLPDFIKDMAISTDYFRGALKRICSLDSPVRTPGHNAPVIHLLTSALCILFVSLHNLLPQFLFSSLFLTYLLPYLSFPLRTDPLRFQAECRKRRLNLA